MTESVSIVLPARDEAVGLRTLLPQLSQILPDAEILVVDDGSRDGTPDIARAAGARVISHPYSLGNGAAVKSGARAARGDLLVLMDADGQHDPADVPQLLAKLAQGYEMSIGARSVKTQASKGRRMANAIYNRVASWMTGHETADLTLSMEHGKPQIIQGVMGETVENIPAAGMTGGKVRRAVNTAPAAGKDPVVPVSTDEMAVTGKTVAEAQGVKGTEQSETVPQSEEDQTGSLVTSPLVGTFYAAPSQDLPPYVQVGDKVKKGQVLAIVEAMKLMNEIESDFDGEIAEIYVENGQPVEYGQKLFRIR